MINDFRNWGPMKKISFIRMAFSVLILAVSVGSFGMDMIVYSQTPNLDHTELAILKEKVATNATEHERRLKDLEDDNKSSVRRLTILETVAESNTYYLRAVTLAIILMAIKEVLVFNAELKRRTQKGRVGDTP